jgi:hypothetical protein
MPKAFSRMPAARVDKRRREHVESRVFIHRKKSGACSLKSGVKTELSLTAARLRISDSGLETV